MTIKQNGSNVIDFSQRLRQKAEGKFAERYAHIKAHCQPGDAELLDSLVNEVELTEAAALEVAEYMTAAHKRGQVATNLFTASVLLQEDAFYDKFGINWWITIDTALIYFAMSKQQRASFYPDMLGAAVTPIQ